MLMPLYCVSPEERLLKVTRRMEKGYGRQGLEISGKKTLYLRFNGHGTLDRKSDINLQGENLEEWLHLNI